MNIEKSTKATIGKVQWKNTNINVLKANDYVVDIIHNEMKKNKMLLINFTSSAGSGKTTLMQKTDERIKYKITMAVMVGDFETKHDTIRIRKSGIQSLQIVAGGKLSFRSTNAPPTITRI